MNTPVQGRLGGEPTSFGGRGPSARGARRFAAAAMLLAGVEYLVAEFVVAGAWSNPGYDWARNLVPDLGNTGVGPNHLGLFVSSPLHALMNAGFVVQGLLFGVAVVMLSRLVGSRTRTALIALAVTQAIGLAVVAQSAPHPGVSTSMLVTNIVAAAVAMVASNVIVIVAGLRWRPLGLPPLLGRAGVVLGAAAIVVGLGLTLLPVPPGISERASIYPFVVWQIVAGAVLLMTRPSTDSVVTDAG